MFSRLVAATFSNWTTPVDAPAANITAIVEEKSGHLWYGTLDGLFGFNDEYHRLV